MADEIRDDYDSPWKEALDFFFEPFIRLCFPHVHEAIDWCREVQFLDKEFQQFVREGEHGRRTVDKLVKVWLKNGQPECVFLHAELQGQPEPDFSERIYVYNYSIFDRYRLPVASLVVLMDDSPGAWCPAEFGYNVFGYGVRFTFPIFKFNEFRSSLMDLERSDNPLALLVLAHFKTQDTRHNFDNRLNSKVELVRMLIVKGFSLDVVRKLVRLIDWLLYLPESYKTLYRTRMRQIEEETKMPFIDCFEESGIATGIEKGIERGLQSGRILGLRDAILGNLHDRFGDVPRPICDKIDAKMDFTELRALINASITAATLAEFESKL